MLRRSIQEVLIKIVFAFADGYLRRNDVGHRRRLWRCTRRRVCHWSRLVWLSFDLDFFSNLDIFRRKFPRGFKDVNPIGASPRDLRCQETLLGNTPPFLFAERACTFLMSVQTLWPCNHAFRRGHKHSARVCLLWNRVDKRHLFMRKTNYWPSETVGSNFCQKICQVL